jgi:hypothetical protein
MKQYIEKVEAQQLFSAETEADAREKVKDAKQSLKRLKNLREKLQ